MIFESLTLKNFGIYRGEHSVDLRVTESKPVILFGALNGGGKTNFLDAIQLVLYGKHAKCSNRPGKAYSKFLASCKNHEAPDVEDSGISLSFTHRTDNKERHFRIERRWKVHNDEGKDHISVFCDKVLDQHLSDHWDDFVSEFIPLSLSELFFFDGEKIEDLAQPQRSADMIRTGIESLLGLDVLSQLQIDLTQLDKKRKAGNVDGSVKEKVAACEQELGKINAELNIVKKNIADIEHNLSDANISVNRAREAVRNAGAHLIEKRDEIKFELGAVESKLKANRAEQVKLAAGARPLGLIKDLIEQTKVQIKLETRAKRAQALQAEITSYNNSLLTALANAPATAIEAAKAAMQAKQKELDELGNVECYLNTDISIFNGLDERIEQEEAQYQKLVTEKEALLKQQSNLEKQLETIPNYESVQHILKDLADKEAALTILDSELQRYKLLQEQLQYRKLATDQRYNNLLTQQNKDSFEEKRTIRVSEHISNIKSTLRGFGEQLVAENIEHLQTLVKQKFDILGRKEQLISRLEISPHNFAITLFGTNGNPIESGRLSAGERQLLSVAILWGLAEASGKELPTVIDTPMGRLDGKHRTKLIENYFPFAGKQVLLLSTDEEIVGKYYQALKPRVNSEYLIDFKHVERSSTISEGYF
ncbi:DNA sulfur modification protein DndD [Marinospirillum insulare]|uniref:DNA sulfur modification protein DndD n=1 Tax=Marinospirillum insulare TaxID=217169 RepID=A0ABQ5ZXI9_9GAMM|nr:DNA sulfur modification protein DndD [Marinospirillum insulare]GLR63735.1 hypothetical protein GCM10007878_11700 [Marinospirillum insulare]